MAKGCGIGCLVAAVVGIVLAFVVFFAIKASIQGKVNEFTADAPVEIEEPDASLDDIGAAIERFDAFREALLKGQPVETLVLDTDDINLLLFYHPNFEEISGSVRAELLDDALAADVSVPLDLLAEHLPIGGGFIKGRYLNGRVTLRGMFSNGFWDLDVESIEVKEVELPEEFLSEIATSLREGLDAQTTQNPDFEKEVEKLKSIIKEIKIEGGKLIVVPMKPAD